MKITLTQTPPPSAEVNAAAREQVGSKKAAPKKAAAQKMTPRPMAVEKTGVQKPLAAVKSNPAAIAVLNFGGPRTLDEVKPFLFEILRDVNTIQLPVPIWMQAVFARVIASRRVGEVRKQYAKWGGRSLLVASTETIVGDVQAELNAMVVSTPLVLAVHRYLPGWAKAAAIQVVEAKIKHVHCLSMYPQFSYATVGSAVAQWVDALGKAGWQGKLTFQRPYPDAPRYVEALVDRLGQSITQHGLMPKNTLILCSAHGLPKAYVAQGDPYQRHIETSVDALRQHFVGWTFLISYQSKVGPAEWLHPYTQDVIPILAEQGYKNVLFVPVSFVNDHIETLHEVGETYFALARQHGVTPFRCPAIENHPSYITLLAEDAYHALCHGCGSGAEALLPKSQFAKRYGWWLGLGVGMALWVGGRMLG